MLTRLRSGIFSGIRWRRSYNEQPFSSLHTHQTYQQSRDVMFPLPKRTASAVVQCPSVCLSHSYTVLKRVNISSDFWYAVYWDKCCCCCYFFIFWQPHHSSFVRAKYYGKIPTGSTSTGRRTYVGMKKSRFSTNHFVLEIIQGKPVTVERKCRMRCIEWCVFLLLTLNDFYFKGKPLFDVEYLRNSTRQ